MEELIFSQRLSGLLSAICQECGDGEEAVVRFVKKHDTEQRFIDTVNKLNIRLKWELLHTLWLSDYNIFKPWFYKVLMDVIRDTSGIDLCKVEGQIHDKAAEFYDYYHDDFEESKDVEKPLSQDWLNMQHSAALDEATDTIIDLIDDGAIDINTLEIIPEYKELLLKKLAKRQDA